jgi:hypothetical protein
MNKINYTLKGFGYDNIQDFLSTNFKIFYISNCQIAITITGILGTIRTFSESFLGMDILVLCVFVFLIIAETQTGIRASVVKNNQKVKSRKIGRMLLKIGVYVSTLFILYSFATRMKNPTVLNFEVNPFEWLYYVYFTGIIFQLVISYLENLGTLGYSEAKGILGIILRKSNKWFEFDGTKDADNEKNS